MPSLTTVLFDWDDTLIDSLPSRVKAVEIIFTRAGIPKINGKEFLFGIKGGSFQKALSHLGAEYRIRENLFDSYRRTYWFELKGSGILFPGIKETLEKLKAAGFTLGIVTGKHNDFGFEGRRIGCSIEIKRTGLDKLFTAVIGLEDVKTPKPDPEGVNLALSRLKSEPCRTLVVGDSDADITAAKTAGCLSCRAVWGITDFQETTGDVKPDFTASKPEDIIKILKYQP